jgi:hypothetical protein
MEERLTNFGELRGVHHFEDILNFVEEHDFLGTVHLWPISKETKHNLYRDRVSDVYQL